MDENDRQLKMMQRRLREEELRILRGQAKVCTAVPLLTPSSYRSSLLSNHLLLLPRPQVDESAIDSQLAEGGRRQLDGGGGRPVGARAGGRPGGAGGGMPRGGGMEADPNVTGGMMMPDDSGSPSDDEDEDDSDEGVRAAAAAAAAWPARARAPPAAPLRLPCPPPVHSNAGRAAVPAPVNSAGTASRAALLGGGAPGASPFMQHPHTPALLAHLFSPSPCHLSSSTTSTPPPPPPPPGRVWRRRRVRARRGRGRDGRR